MDLEERKDESGDSQKYEKLYQRDREMTEFIESFPTTKIKARHGVITTLLPVVMVEDTAIQRLSTSN